MKLIEKILISLFSTLLIFLYLNSTISMTEEVDNTMQDIKLTVLYDNYSYEERLHTSWGFSCLVEMAEKTILFDTGAKDNKIIDNMNALNISPEIIDEVVISHDHWDHTGGLEAVLQKNPNVTVYLLESFSVDTKRVVKSAKAKLVEVADSFEILPRVYTTGEIEGSVNEQTLILKTVKGLIIISGCAHPGIVKMIKESRKIAGGDVLFVIGGFHLMQHSKAAIEMIIEQFKDIGVQYVAATHCTGDSAIAMFKKAYGEKYIQAGVGRVLTLDDF